MHVLGIDTSCDDTSAGVVVAGRHVLSSVVHSQINLHSRHGGVVPELASRAHVRNIMPVVREAVARAGLTLEEIDAVAVTIGPGLVGSLLVGLYYAKALSSVRKMHLAAVNHLEGHILSVFLEPEAPSFPFVCLTVSGGHTSIYHVKGYGDYVQMGQTLDDAAGEAYDKVAKILGLGYPGGPVIERIAKSGRRDAVSFPRAYLSSESLDFSFSGLKTSVSLFVKEWRRQPDTTRKESVADIAASFEEAVIDVLVRKIFRAQELVGARAVVVAGGVACNGRLRSVTSAEAEKRGVRFYYPRPSYCTDNGAMIAAAGYHRLMKGDAVGSSVDVRSRYPIGDI
ncbi:MAG TPA: tRNA (adenosine(37)-N6)-threonylcarbamoyltransferase complex transferase subunit TsaD [Desulfobacteraceae bacterium]|nr:tRNA (adenosine(37)-N6)-threonylcarbamoyltransferase complex transferase subunit TsaD [Desulfobacteraceae bacterium]